MERELWTTRDLARFLRVSVQTVERYCRKGILPFVKLPSGQLRFEQGEIIRWLRERDETRTDLGCKEGEISTRRMP